MRVYRVDGDRCRMCLKCMQECPAEAILPEQKGLRILDSRCTDCGVCYAGCPHGGIVLDDQVERVREFIRSKRKVILSLDPACRAVLPVSLEHLAAAVQRLGVWDVADASEAYAAVAAEYARLLREKYADRLILAHCPVVRNLVEQHFPALISYLAPVASPMIAHGRMLKRDFTSAAVVYVTTCAARQQEARDVRHSTEINAVLTVPQLLNWLRQENISLEGSGEEPLLSDQGGVGALGAVSGGMGECIRYFLPEHGYRVEAADGLEQCRGLLEAMNSGELKGCVLDLTACTGGCVGGPAGICPPQRYLPARLALERQVEEEGREPYFDTKGIAMANPAIARPAETVEPDEAQIQDMLYRIGVGNPRQQKNCGACGYATCRERAEAILRHREPVSLCRQVVQEARRDVFRVVYEKLPMAALLVDEDQRVVGLNQEACSLFTVRPDQEKYIFELMDPRDFQYVLDTGLAIKSRRLDIPEIYMRVEADLVPLKELHMVLGLFRDITAEEEAEAQRQQSRLQSVEMAQRVIEKQMTVAQQIAFLLGETTAETKVTLNRLKQRILGEDES